jgi:hypothetical protein
MHELMALDFMRQKSAEVERKAEQARLQREARFGRRRVEHPRGR